MKRPPPSFVVEVRRQRRPAGEPVRSWFEEPELAEAPAAAQAIFAEPPSEPVERTPGRPVGRILQSLVESPAASQDAEPVKPRKPRADAGKTRVYKTRGDKTRVDKTRGAKTPAAKTPAPRRIAPHVPAPYAAPATPPVQSQAPARVTSESDKSSRAERHTRILTRYVFGEPKAGEGWKRRLQRGER